MSKGTGGPGDTMPSYAILALGTSASETGVDLTDDRNRHGQRTGRVELARRRQPQQQRFGRHPQRLGVLARRGRKLLRHHHGHAPADKQCSTGATIADPNYPSQLSVAPPNLNAPNPTPICAATNAVLQFVPGYYTNDTMFQTPAYTQGANVCKTNYLYFRPGVYYFDFGFDPAFTDLIWNVAASQFVVGGEPKGWDPNTANSLPATPTGGNSVACKTAADGATSGVQFVFGGASQMVVTTSAAKVELCADPTPVGTNQQIAVYGQTSGTTALATTTDEPVTSAPTPATGWSGLTPVNTRASDQPERLAHRHDGRVVLPSRQRHPLRRLRCCSTGTSTPTRSCPSVLSTRPTRCWSRIRRRPRPPRTSRA